MKGFFSINGKLQIQLPRTCINDTVKEVVYGLLYRAVEISYVPVDGVYVKIGDAAVPLHGQGEGFISVTETGICLTAINERALLNALFLLLRRVRAENLERGKELLVLPVCEETVRPKVARRMLHFCVFPRASLDKLKKQVRLACVLGYTHIVFEFWGSFPYECLPELAWKNASFTKAEICDLIREANDLKVEAVPMLNSFGHASASRMVYGKHVVLDQNPRFSTLFSADGWWWRFDKKEVRALFQKMRGELYEVFGEGEYFHIGFDESFSYPTDDLALDALGAYLRDLCEEIVAEGRKPLIWGDQFLHEETLGIGIESGYEGNAPSNAWAEKLLSCLPKEAIVCDWQYFVKENPWKSAVYFTNNGRKTMTCPWIDRQGILTALKTAETLNCYGFLLTTWDKKFNEVVHTLFYTHDVLYGRETATKKVGNSLENAAFFRKIFFADGDYERAGWTERDL